MQLDTGGASLYFDQSGQGPGIPCLAGGGQPGDDGRLWQTPYFDERFRSTTYDAWGVGRTVARPEPPWPISEHAWDAAALIEKCCEAPVFLIGLSMGSLLTGVPRYSERFPAEPLADVAADMRDGGRLERLGVVCRGHPSPPLQDDEIAAKFRGLGTAARSGRHRSRRR